MAEVNTRATICSTIAALGSLAFSLSGCSHGQAVSRIVRLQADPAMDAFLRYL